jgi:hypothetical protein
MEVCAVIQVIIEALWLLYVIIYLVFAAVYLARSSYKLNPRNFLVFLLLGAATLWFYYIFSSFVLNMAKPPGKDVGQFVSRSLWWGWLFIPYIGSIAGFRGVKRHRRIAVISFAIVGIASIALAVYPITRIRLFLKSRATDICEYQQLRGWGNIHLLRARLPEGEFNHIVGELNYRLAPRDFSCPLLYDNLKWWGIADVPASDWEDSTKYYDPQSKPLTKRVLTYVNGHLYYCEYEVD